MRDQLSDSRCNELTITSLLAAQAACFGDREAITGMANRDCANQESLTRTLSYADLARNNSALAQKLTDLGVRRDSRLAVVLPNGVDLAVGLLSACSAAVAVPLSAEFQASEYRSYFCISRTTHLLTSGNAPPSAMWVAAEMNLPTFELEWCGDGFDIAGEKRQSPRPGRLDAPEPADIVAILMTSGSTGQPKRVPLSHRNLCVAAHSVARSLNLCEQDRCLVMWEQYHIGGLVDLLLAPLASGSRVYCAGGFDAELFFDAVDTLRPTWFQGVPTTLRELLIQGKLRGQLPWKDSSLRFLRSVAAPLHGDVMAQLENAFGVPVIQTFGMTEAAPLITTNQLPPGKRKPGSTGTPVGCEVAVMDDHGNQLPSGRTGEIAVRGDNVFEGYEDDPKSNAACFRDGWFYTGDIGHVDQDGFLFLSGRVKELINRGGEKISPAEVESIAVRHPAIEQAVAFSIPHPTLGEDVAMAVVTKPTRRTDSESVRDFLAEHLSGFKVPSVVLFLTELPRCPIGKIRRKELAKLVSNGNHSIGTTVRQPNGRDDQPVMEPLENRLAQLWATHLDVASVGPTDDFRMLGGDSLSQIRLMLAAESLFVFTFPDQANHASLTTVRKLATEIRSLGGRIPGTPNEPPSSLSDVDRRVTGDVEVGSNLSDSDPETIRRRLVESQTVLDFNATAEALLNTLTLDELYAVLPASENGLRRTASQLARLLRSLGQTQADRMVDLKQQTTVNLMKQWRRDLTSETGAGDCQRWTRSRAGSNAYLYRQDHRSSAGRCLVVGFAGNHMRLMLPTHSLLSHFGPRYDLLVLGDVDRNHFANGMPGLGDNIGELCEWVRRTSTSFGYEVMTVLGTSAGGLAAIACGYVLECDRVTVLGADAPSSHSALSTFIQAKNCRSHHPLVLIGYDELNDRDREAALEITKLVPRHHAHRFQAGGAHNLLQPALKSRELQSLFNKWFDGASG